MIHVFNLFFQCRDILVGKPLCHNHGKSTRSKIFRQDILSHHRFDILRQIRENIIIDSRIHIAEKCRNQKEKTQNENDITTFYNSLT